MDFGGDLSSPPVYVKGNGDGTVNARSLRGCSYWLGMKDQGNHSVTQMILSGAEHYDIMRDARAINYVLKLLTGVDGYVPKPRRFRFRNPLPLGKLKLF